jgi:hypothetical protein
MFGVKEVLVAAKHPIALDGVWIDAPTEPVSYFHVMMDQHAEHERDQDQAGFSFLFTNS